MCHRCQPSSCSACPAHRVKGRAGFRAAGMQGDADTGAASLGQPGTYRDLCAPRVPSWGPPALPCPLTRARSCPQLVYSFSSLPMQIYDWHSNITEQKTSTGALRSTADPTPPAWVMPTCPAVL